MAVELVRRRFTVDAYDQMVAAGILGKGDHVELLDGQIVEMSPTGSPHRRCVNRLTMLLAPALAPHRLIVQVQAPIRLGDYWEPEPDVAVLRAEADDDSLGHPTPEDVLLLIEVADSSVAYDRAKLPAYARHGIAEVWLVNLNEGLILSYRDPVGEDYGLVRAYRRGETLSPQFRRELTLSVDAILP